jgi:hypothetical protein
MRKTFYAVERLIRERASQTGLTPARHFYAPCENNAEYLAKIEGCCVPLGDSPKMTQIVRESAVFC